MEAARQLFGRPGVRARLAAVVLTAAALLPLLPLLLRLPKVAVVACFGAGHPLYQWVPQTGSGDAAHCVSAPTQIVGWTLMIAATLLVQLVLLPLILGLGARLVGSARGLAHAAGQALTRVLSGLPALLVPQRRPQPVYVRSTYVGFARPVANPRRGPPTCHR